MRFYNLLPRSPMFPTLCSTTDLFPNKKSQESDFRGHRSCRMGKGKAYSIELDFQQSSAGCLFIVHDCWEDLDHWGAETFWYFCVPRLLACSSPRILQKAGFPPLEGQKGQVVRLNPPELYAVWCEEIQRHQSPILLKDN